jgi:6-phosphogluconolactonase
VEVDPNGKYVFVGNYGSGTLSAIPVDADGSLKTDVQTIKHEGTSIDKARQTAPHVHSTFVSPDNKYLLVPDLGTDKINIYTIDPGKGAAPLSPANQPFAQVKGGSGPRHLAFLPKSKYIYAVQEMGAMVTVFDYTDGKLTEKQTISMLPKGFTGSVGAADIHLSPDGKFLYASNRGEANDLAIYSVGKNGMLEHIGNQPVGGKTPRNFAIDPTGNYLLVANQTSNDIIIFKRDKKTGKLTQTENKLQVSRPVCIKFVPTK